MATTNVYVLKLADGKYYVGKSQDPQQRFQQHRGGTGSVWTQKYKPIAMEKVISNCSPLDEDKITKEYMMKYGMDNVRGGTYVENKLDDFQKEALRREMRTANDCCARCGRSGHFINQCYASTVVDELDISDDESEYCDDDYESQDIDSEDIDSEDIDSEDNEDYCDSD